MTGVREWRTIMSESDGTSDKAGTYRGIDTLLLHAGQTPAPGCGARAVPIYQTSSYVFDSAGQAADLFSLKRPGNIYTRMMNPTTDVFEQRLAAMERGTGAIATSSGMSAIFLAIQTIAGAGDHIVASASLYGGTDTLFRYTFAGLGIDVTFVDRVSPESVAAAIRPETKAVYVETISNPGGDVPDLRGIADVAHAAGVPLVVDNTFAPLLCRPIDHGADVVVHSTTKWICGHGTSLGGAIIDSGRFDWTGGRFPGFTTPDESYHGVVYARDFEGTGFVMKARLQGMRNIGMCPSPFNSFLLLQGLETLDLRMRAHCGNAMKLAEWLETCPDVAWVNYAGLTTHRSHENAARYLAGGFGAVLGFGIRGGAVAGAAFIDSVDLASHLANVGDAKTLVLHPASTTHQQMTPEGLAACGISPEFIRVAVGLEDIGDILADFAAAFDTAHRMTVRIGVTENTRFADIPGGLQLESGAVIESATIAYRTWGSLNGAADNAVVICHALTGSADADDWWKGMIGPGLAFDPDRDFIVCANLPGGCYGSTGPVSTDPATGRRWGPGFPTLTIRDMVNAQAALTRLLGVKKIRLVAGGSLGGMLSLEWAAMYPDEVAAAVTIASCERHTAWGIGLSSAQRAAIQADPDWCDGWYEPHRPPAAGLGVARMIAMCTYRSPENFEERFGRQVQNDDGQFAVESYLRYQGAKLVNRFDANTYMVFSRAMDSHDIGRGRGGCKAALGAIRQPVLVVSYDSDVLYPPSVQRAMADGIPRGVCAELHSSEGHDSFLIHTGELAAVIREFRAEVEK